MIGFSFLVIGVTFFSLLTTYNNDLVLELPRESLSADSVLELASKYDMYGKFAIDEGRVSGAVYTDRSPEHIDLLTKVLSSMLIF